MSQVTKAIEKERAKIDAINSKIIKLIGERTSIAKKIGILKKQENIAIKDHEREHHMLTKVRSDATLYEVDRDYIENVFKAIIKGAQDAQK